VRSATEVDVSVVLPLTVVYWHSGLKGPV